jgi:cytochrome c-type biogenesis protein CcmH/NrfG
MSFLNQLKIWGAAVVGGVILVGLLLLQVFNAGRKGQRADDIQTREKLRKNFDDKAQTADDSGNAMRDELRNHPERVREPDPYKRR